MRPPRCLVAALTTVLALSCDSPPAPPESQQATLALTKSASSVVESSVDPFASLELCRIEQAGPFLDLGAAGIDGLRAFRLEPVAGLTKKVWQAQGHARFNRRTADYNFWLSEAMDNSVLRLHAQGKGARMLSVNLDGRSIGSRRVASSNFKTVSFRIPQGLLKPGRHQIGLTWSSRRRAPDLPYGLVRWIQVTDVLASGQKLQAPQEETLRHDVVLQGNVHRSLVLRSSTKISCPVSVSDTAVLKVSLGYWGEGKGTAQIRALRDNTPPIALMEVSVAGGETARWQDVTIPLERVGGGPFHLEFSAPRGTQQGAVAFGEPKILDRVPAPRAKPLAWVVGIFLGGLHRDLLPPFARHGLPNLQSFADESTRFTNYRVPTTRVAGVMATLLTGIAPHQHLLDHARVSLNSKYPWMPETLQGRTGRSALFTAVPHTRSEFGFGRGWNQFSSYSPVDDIAASQPFHDARTWIGSERFQSPHQKHFVLIHAQGAHPPWDVSESEISTLPPKDYHGILEARRGGILLASVRNRRRRSSRRLRAPDWIRLKALQHRALSKQDAALGRLRREMQEAGIWDEALVLLAGDVASGEPPEAPFGDGRPLEESRLLVPLWVKFPKSEPSPHTSGVAVRTDDLAKTIAQALALDLPMSGSSLSLQALSTAGTRTLVAPHVATREASYATRWGSWLLKGTSPREPRLCQLSVDPACATDLLADHPLLAEALWKATYRSLYRPGGEQGSEVAERRAKLTKETAAALRVWGD